MLAGLDPQMNYTVCELSLKPGAASFLPQEGKTIRRDALMRHGLALPIAEAFDSVVVELNVVR